MQQSDNGSENESHENQSTASKPEEMIAAMGRIPTAEDQNYTNAKGNFPSATLKA